ncbi:hypothetical protein PTKU64_61260 [Paraburkholderia terrae]|uniref:Uncharacterized protein n=1 Tax=Paraburkholderia terrae TaxID=311230 RepID=A0ABM7TTM5_9BURK|nr:hypothetical protein PTKU64_61260 [Paraburkholderia terrae]
MAQRHAQIEERGAATDNQPAIERIDDGQRPQPVHAHLHGAAVDHEVPRLRVVIGRRQHRVLQCKAQLRVERRGRIELRFVDFPCRTRIGVNHLGVLAPDPRYTRASPS